MLSSLRVRTFVEKNVTSINRNLIQAKESQLRVSRERLFPIIDLLHDSGELLYQLYSLLKDQLRSKIRMIEETSCSLISESITDFADIRHGLLNDLETTYDKEYGKVWSASSRYLVKCAATYGSLLLTNAFPAKEVDAIIETSRVCTIRLYKLLEMYNMKINSRSVNAQVNMPWFHFTESCKALMRNVTSELQSLYKDLSDVNLDTLLSDQNSMENIDAMRRKMELHLLVQKELLDCINAYPTSLKNIIKVTDESIGNLKSMYASCINVDFDMSEETAHHLSSVKAFSDLMTTCRNYFSLAKR